MTLAPELAGAKKVIQEINGLKRVVYISGKGNPYGVEAGIYLGEYKKEVTVDGKETSAYFGRIRTLIPATSGLETWDRIFSYY